MKTFSAKMARSLGVVGAAGLAMVSGAHAALPAAATTALADVGTANTDAVGAAWPYIGAALAAGITIKLVKRYTNKV